MKILVTGGLGQLGNSLKKISKDYDFDFVFTDVEDLDITDRKQVDDFLSNNDFSFVINSAAYTAVDNAEKDQEKCYLINNIAVENLAKSCKKNNVFLIHVSTDYVFDGEQARPYSPFDKTNPLGFYGKTKLLGEEKALQYCENSIIVRTSGLYSEFGRNFVKTMLNLCSTKETIGVVFDQTISPCYATSLAKMLMKTVEKITKEKTIDNKYRILHFSNEGVLSWYDFAKKINELAGLHCNIKPIRSFEYPTLATRPAYSVLDKSLTKEYLSISIPYWEDDLKECLNQLL